MDKKFDLQNYLATIPQINDEKDIENLFNVMNVVANLSIPIGQKTALLNQMESKLKDNPKFQEITESHKPEIEKMQKIMANLAHDLAEKKEQVNKQQQEIKTGQQFNLQQLNLLKGYELYKYVMDNMTDPSQWDQIAPKQQKELIKQSVKEFRENPNEENAVNLTKIMGLASKSPENLNTILDEIQNLPEKERKIFNDFFNSKKGQALFDKWAGGANVKPEEKEFLKNVFIVALSVGKHGGICIELTKDGIEIKPDTEENRIRYKKILDEKIKNEKDPKVKEALQFVSAQIVEQEIKRNKIFKGYWDDFLLHKPIYKVYDQLSEHLNKAFDIFQKFNANSKWDIVNLVRSEHNTLLGQLLHSQLTLYLVGDKDAKEDVLNNAFFRNLYEKSKAQGNDHYLFKTVLEGMWFDEKSAEKILSLIEKDLQNNPTINPDHTGISKKYCKEYMQERDNYYHIAIAVSQHIDKNIKAVDVYDVFRRINNSEKLSEMDLYILDKIKELEENPSIKYNPLIKGTSIKSTNSEILEKFYKVTQLDSEQLEQLIQNNNQPKEVKTEHISERPDKILAVADMKQSKAVAEEFYNNNYSDLAMKNPIKKETEEHLDKGSVGSINDISNSSLNG
ncbi:hypothetical protein [Lonepinella sp. BR2271]|uniref:hypothetical protein n=1 Tax=Lonepinella sp. BR2271 TaxID=3434550 RepID=UPI003F6E048E